MAKKDDVKTADMGNLSTESANKPVDMGDLKTKATKTVDLGRLTLPKFKKFQSIKKKDK